MGSDHSNHDVAAPPCDCCEAADSWEYLFTLSGRDLGRCSNCGLHYIAQMPSADQRMTEFEKGHFSPSGSPRGVRRRSQSQADLTGDAWFRVEQVRRPEISAYIDVVEKHAPPGRWLDVGCGTGTLVTLARHRGFNAEGVELDADRRRIAAQHTGAQIYDRPIEDLDLSANSYSAVTLVNVFSHVVSPTETLREIRRILVPGGVVLLHTSEVGPGVRAHHHRTWMLGDHLSFLGDHTIERYADKLDMQLVHREQVWQPESAYSRERMMLRGSSPIKNAIKWGLRVMPGALRLLRWYAIHRREADSPMYESTLVLRKPNAVGA